MKRRIKIGLLIDDIDSSFTQQTCRGAELGAINIDANLYIFPMKYLDSRDFLDDHSRFEYQYNMICRFITEKNIDILYVLMGNIGCRTEYEKQIEFLNNLPDIPIVTLYTSFDGYPSVTFNNKTGLEGLLDHLFDKHDVKKIGYVSGPLTNGDAVERLQVFKETIENKGITYDENKVVYGNFEAACEDVVEDLLDRNPDLEAVVFANDLMALGGYNVFKRRGMIIGKDILVTGFDNAPFSSSIIPSLTTIDANPANLAFRAVTQTYKFLKDPEFKFEIETFFINRESCGCEYSEITTYELEMDLRSVFDKKDLPYAGIFEYLFGEYSLGKATTVIEDHLKDFLGSLFDVVKNKDFKKRRKHIKELFSIVIQDPILSYTTTEKIFNMLMVTQRQTSRFLDSDKDMMDLSELFSMIYRTFTMYNSQMLEKKQEHIMNISEMVNRMTSEIFVYDGNTEEAYQSMFTQFDKIGIASAYMLSFKDIIKHYRCDEWIQPQSLNLKAYEVEGVVGVLSMEDAEVSINDIFENQFLPEHRVTMVLTPLYSFEEVYGVLLCEVNYSNLDCITPISIQLSSALKSLILIEKQRMVQRELENNLRRIEESNNALDELSKSDELTGIYNRRGFIENAEKAIKDKKNHGKTALVFYSDMDNLKKINDVYGHDDGDFALKEIANILLDTFRSSDIVSRFGGDEFVCFALVKIEGKGPEIKQRMEIITENHNALARKPYTVDMSTGYCEFECRDDVDIYKILDMADQMLYEEKKKKKIIEE